MPTTQQSTPQSNSEQQLQRLFSITACKTQVELAKLLDMSVSSVRNTIKKVRDGADIPATWLVSLSRSKGVPPEWILTGNGPSAIVDIQHVEMTYDIAGSHYQSAEFLNANPHAQKALQEFSIQLLLREVLYREYAHTFCVE